MVHESDRGCERRASPIILFSLHILVHIPETRLYCSAPYLSTFKKLDLISDVQAFVFMMRSHSYLRNSVFGNPPDYAYFLCFVGLWVAQIVTYLRVPWMFQTPHSIVLLGVRIFRNFVFVGVFFEARICLCSRRTTGFLWHDWHFPSKA